MDNVVHGFHSELGLPVLKYNILAAIDQVYESRGDHFSHFVRRRRHIDDSSGLGRRYLVLSHKQGTRDEPQRTSAWEAKIQTTRRLKSFTWDALVYGRTMAFYLG